MPWQNSALQGSPEPPRPYTAEVLWPHLAFDKALDLALLKSRDTLFVVEQKGKIWLLPADLSVSQPSRKLCVDLAEHISPFDSVFGLAFHPQFESNQEVFLFYRTHNKSEDGTRISRFRLNPGDLSLDPSSEEILVTFRAGGHNGGHLGFGPDGMLYILTGDAEVPNPPDPLLTGQDVSDLLSSILRIDVDRRSEHLPYAIPPDNPFVNLPEVRPEIWAYGFRNPWKLCFHPETGDLWVGDVGWELWEMLHRVERGGNYGWSILEGPQPILPNQSFGPAPILPPAIVHPHTEMASITGGYVYQGDRLPALKGAYLYGDFVTGQLWGLWHDGERTVRHEFLADTRLQIVSFGQAAEGEVIFLDWPNQTHLYRIIANPNLDEPSRFPTLLSKTGLFSNTAEQIPSPGVYPFRIKASQWQDGAISQYWLGIPGGGAISFPQRGPLPHVPEGTVLAKTLSQGESKMETQILHYHRSAWQGYTYRWNPGQTDAELVPKTGDTAKLDGERWTLHSRTECARCHNLRAGHLLAFQPAQLDCDDQLASLQSLGLINEHFVQRASQHPLTDPYNLDAPLDLRARSWLSINCAHCHRRGGGQSTTLKMNLEATPEEMDLIECPPLRGHFDLENPQLIKPGDPYRSVLYLRCMTEGNGRMPMIGSRKVDIAGAQLLHDWIRSMAPQPEPGTPTLPNTLAEALQLAHLLDQDALTASQRSAILEAASRSSNLTIRDLFQRFQP